MSRIERIETSQVVVDLHTPFVTAVRRTRTVETVVVQVVDSDGVAGWGEAPQAWRITGDSLAGVTACVKGPVTGALRGVPADPRVAGPLLQDCVVANAGARMAVDTALHDLAARRAGRTLATHLAAYAGTGQPVGSLRVRTDVTLAAGEPEALAEAARARVADGFTTLKVKVGTDAATDVQRVRAVRGAVGPDIGLRLDANQGWDAHEAVRVVHAIEDAGLDVALVEQPVPARDLIGLAHVTAHVDTPVMADESLVDLDDLVALVRLGACDLVNVKLAKCGGIGPALELLDLARRHGLGTMVGSMMETHLGVGAAASMVAAVGTTVSADLDAAWWCTATPYVGGPTCERDQVVLPASPGLGVSALIDHPLH